MKKNIILLLLSLFLLTACGEKNVKEKKEKLEVAVSTYPMYFIAKEIGGENVHINSLIPIGVDPHDYELSLKEIKNLEDTDLFLYNGAGLENWGEKVADDLREKQKVVIDASSKVDLLDSKDDHDEEDEHENHGSKDPHIWLDPTNMDKIAKSVADELKLLDSENKDKYEKNYEEFSRKINQLDSDYKEGLENRKHNTILVSHKAFSYLSNRYGLEQISVTGISPHAEPSPKSLSKLIDLTREKDINYIFFEVLSSPKSVEMLAKEANLRVLTLNPIGGITKEEFDKRTNYFDIMEENLVNLKKALVE